MRSFERIELLDELLRNKTFPNYDSFNDLLVEHQGEQAYSKRSFERDIKEIREKLEIRFPTIEEPLIKFNALKKGYEYIDGYSIYTNLSKHEKANIVELAKFLELNPQLLSQRYYALFQKIKGLAIEHQLSEKHPQLTWSPVQLIEQGKRAGQDYFESMLQHIQNLQPISIQYQSLQRGKIHEHKILPLLLKEHMGAWYTGWYLLAYPLPKENKNKPVELDDLIVFALDRIKSVEVLSTNLRPKFKKSFNPHDFFKNIFGIVRYNLMKPASTPQKITLESKSDWAYYYLKQYKIHPSQKTIIDDVEKHYLKIELFVEINIDLVLLLHKQVAGIRVLKPAKLVKEVKGVSE